MLSTRSDGTRRGSFPAEGTPAEATEAAATEAGGARRRLTGAVDWIARGMAGLLLVATTACAGPGAVTQAAGTGVVRPATAAPAGPPSGMDTAPLDPASKALQVLDSLPVKGRAPKTGYSRDQFGPAWADVDHNGCDTRNDMLRRDLTALAFKPGTRDCVVLSGVLADPYTAEAISFARGNGTSTAVQVDHVVALSDAWQKGAQQLTAGQRLAFANDPLNLLAVDGPANQSKSDGDAATWLPPNKAYRCDYVARQISVKSSYGLWVTQAERDAMARVLADCPDALAPTNPPAAAAAPAPAAAMAPTNPPPAAPAAAPAPANPPPAAPAQVHVAPAPAPGAAVSYANCAAVRAAGAAPIRAGQPGYNGKLDRDGDGVGCE